MLISQSNLALTSSHQLERSTSREIQAQFGEPPGSDTSFGKIFQRQLQSVPAELLQIEAPSASQASAAAAQSPFQAILEMLFGLRPLPSLAALPGGGDAAAGGFGLGGLQLVTATHTSETETCSFAASGNVCLADGSTRQFDVGYRMERSEQSTQVGIAEFKDPLAVDFGAPGTALTGNSVAFDIDSDGQTEDMRLPAGDCALLFCDRNHNGLADNGSELFGPQSGNGFGELAQLDADGNGWVDGGDAAYADLMLWQLAEDGSSSVESLAAAGVGALATSAVATPFTLKEDGAAVAQVRSSSVWLGEESGAGIVRQIDVGVTQENAPSA